MISKPYDSDSHKIALRLNETINQTLYIQQHNEPLGKNKPRRHFREIPSSYGFDSECREEFKSVKNKF